MTGRPCKCECGETVPFSRKYVNKEHQISHMRSGEAARLSAKQSPEAKRKGGAAAGRAAAQSGRLAMAGRKGADRIAEIARRSRDTPGL